MAVIPRRTIDAAEVIQVRKISDLKNILDPRSKFLEICNKIFLVSCLLAVAGDALFLYVPTLVSNRLCYTLDEDLKLVALLLRYLVDVVYIGHMLFKFRTAVIARPVFGLRWPMAVSPWIIARRYISTLFIVDFLSILPVPQVLCYIIPRFRVSPIFFFTAILGQYIPRFLRMLPLYSEIKNTAGCITETAFAWAVSNLFLFLLASHVFGACWYLLSIAKKGTCWQTACRGLPGCVTNLSHCNLNKKAAVAVSDDLCLKEGDFHFGVHADSLKFGLLESRNHLWKMIYSFLWGLQSMSSFGQSLEKSAHISELIFIVTICVAGLVLFALLIGNMQAYLQTSFGGQQEMKTRRQDIECWMSQRRMPKDLRWQIRRHEKNHWRKHRGFDEEKMLKKLPGEIRMQVKKHLYWDVLKRARFFKDMDDEMLTAICEKLLPVVYPENSCVIKERDMVSEIMFVLTGKMTWTTEYGGSHHPRTNLLDDHDFCGEELIAQGMGGPLSRIKCVSTRTVTAKTEVEGFILTADDLQCVASRFPKMYGQKLKRVFRLHSYQWLWATSKDDMRTWASINIQRAWRHHRMEKARAAEIIVPSYVRERASENLEIALRHQRMEEARDPRISLRKYERESASKYRQRALREQRMEESRAPGIRRFPRLERVAPEATGPFTNHLRARRGHQDTQL